MRNNTNMNNGYNASNNGANTANNEMMELQARYKELQAKASVDYTSIGKLYYDKTGGVAEPGFEECFASLKISLDQMKQIDTRVKFLRGIVVCSACGEENGVEGSFCSSCGTRLPHTYSNDGANRCGNCGSSINPGTKFCATCGAKIETPVVAEPVVLTKTKTCPKCGIDINEEDSLFCPECGTKLE